MTLVGIIGFAGSGKDTIADFFVNDKNFIKDSFARTLKDAASVLFGWDRDMLDGTTSDSRKWREIPDPYWSTQMDKKEFTPRLALQLLGTEAIRETFFQDFWVSTVIKRYLENGKPNTVITDCRFPNEINAIRQNGGKIIHVARDNYPEWFPLLERINQKRNSDMDMVKFQTMLLNKELPHSSEYAWIGHEYDVFLDNSGSLEDLNNQIHNIQF